MINLLTKIRDYVKLLLPSDQKPLLLSNKQPDQKEVASENTGFVSPSENIPAENKQSSQAYTDKECDFIIEALKSLSPEYLLIISEMRNLLNSDLKKIVFHALATKLSIEEVAGHLGLTPRKVKCIFQEAIMDISIQSGFVRGYLDNGVQKDIEIDTLHSKIQLLKDQLMAEGWKAN